jgi:hypothetical protein
VNLLVRAQDGVVRVHLMAVDLGRLGMLLAALSDAPIRLPVSDVPEVLSRQLPLQPSAQIKGQQVLL